MFLVTGERQSYLDVFSFDTLAIQFFGFLTNGCIEIVARTLADLHIVIQQFVTGCLHLFDVGQVCGAGSCCVRHSEYSFRFGILLQNATEKSIVDRTERVGRYLARAVLLISFTAVELSS